MSVITLWVISVFWILYGIAGLLGFENLPEKYKYKSWTSDYIRMNGICKLLLGVGWFILGFVLRAFSLSLPQQWGLGLLFALPAVGYGLYADRKTKDWRRQANWEWREKYKNR